MSVGVYGGGGSGLRNGGVHAEGDDNGPAYYVLRNPAIALSLKNVCPIM